MKISKGKNRIVLILPSMGVVVKIAIISPIKSFRCLFRTIKSKNWKYLRREFMSPFGRGIPKFKDYLLLGIIHNWLEFWFYVKTKNTFLQPTYFSLLGLFNIQKLGKVSKFSFVNLRCQLHELTKGKIWKHSHHFSNSDNFCFDGKLRMFDYGDKRTQEVIQEYGSKIFKEFNPDFDWEGEKQKKTP